MNNKYPDYGINSLALCGSEHIKVMNTMKDVLLSEAKDNNTSLIIKNIVVHIYPCKCLFNLVGFVNNKSFDILGKEKTVTDAYKTIRFQLFNDKK